MIQCALNGDYTAADHPAVPVTLEQLVADSAACHAAGAASVHLHPHRPEGGDSMAAAVLDPVVAAVRAAVPGLEISCSTHARIDLGGAADHRAAVRGWTCPPDAVSLNLEEPGSIELGDGAARRRRRDRGRAVHARRRRRAARGAVGGARAPRARRGHLRARRRGRRRARARDRRARRTARPPAPVARRRARELGGRRRGPAARPRHPRRARGHDRRPRRRPCAVQRRAGRGVRRAASRAARRASERWRPSASKFAGSSHASKAAPTAGHSPSSSEYQAVSRLRSLTSMCWRKTPSKVKPKRSAARRERSLPASHFHSSRRTLSSSNAWRESRWIASVAAGRALQRRRRTRCGRSRRRGGRGRSAGRRPSRPRGRCPARRSRRTAGPPTPRRRQPQAHLLDAGERPVGQVGPRAPGRRRVAGREQLRARAQASTGTSLTRSPRRLTGRPPGAAAGRAACPAPRARAARRAGTAGRAG